MRLCSLVVSLLLFGGISKADLVLEFRGDTLSPCVDGKGCILEASISLLQPLPGNFSISSDDVTGTFQKYFDNYAATVSDGDHTFRAALTAAFPDTLSLNTDASGNVGSLHLEVQIDYLDHADYPDVPIGIERWETVTINGGIGGYGGSVITKDIFDHTAYYYTSGIGTVLVTPEPGSLVSLGTAVIGLGWMEWKRRRSQRKRLR
jgi:hypothetical protein